MTSRILVAFVFAASLARSVATAQTADAGGAFDGGATLDAGTVSDASAHADDALVEPPLPADLAPRVELRLEPPGEIAVGDALTVRLRATVRDGDDVTVPPQSFAPFEVRRKSVRTEVAAGKRSFVFTLELVAFEAGTHALGPIHLRIVTREGTIGGHTVDAREVHVRSLIANEPDAQPKAESRPVAVREPDPRPRYALYALLAMAIGAALALAIRRYLARRPKVVPPPPPPRPPWEIAVEKLDALRRDRHRLIEEGAAEVFADGVSDTVREYLGARYGFDGLECTTDEIVTNLQTVRAHGISVPEVQALLGDCDLVKFARQSFTPEQADTILALGYRLVRSTTPVAIMPPSPGAPGTPGASR